NWPNETETWSMAEFDEPREAKFIRLTALSTYGEGNQADQYMTAGEIRLRKAPDERESLENAKVTLDQDVFTYDGEEKTPQATVTLVSKELEEGIDYRVTYEDNVEVGEAKILIEGIVKYEGTFEETFTIQDNTISTISELQTWNNQHVETGNITNEEAVTIGRAAGRERDMSRV